MRLRTFHARLAQRLALDPLDQGRRFPMRAFRLHQASRSNQEDQAEDVFYPVETRQQADASCDEKRAHDNRACDSPKENAVLLMAVEMKRPKHDQEDEEVVDTEGGL